MAYASITYTSASGTTFALTNSSGDPIPYLRQADIAVTVNGTLKTQGTDYTFNSAGTAIVFSVAVSNATVSISRITDISDATVVYTAGSTLTAQDLNNADNQIRFGLQEFSDTYAALTTGTGDLQVLGGFIGSAETWTADNAHAATTGAIDGRIDSKIDTALTTDVVAGDSLTITDNSPASGQITIGVTNASISTAKLVDSSVTTAKIADGNVTTAKILDSNVTTAKIADSNVTTAKIADSAVTSAKIADGTIVASDLASDAVTTAKILDANVTTGKIADGAVTTGKLADSSVTSAKIADGTIVAGDLASDSVTTAKILDANVTTAKIADSNVTTGKIADSAVTAIKIADGVITSAKLNASTVVTNAEQSASTPDDTSFFTTSASDARYDARYVNVTGDTMSGALAMGSNKITDLGTPTANADAATKLYVDNSVAAGVGDADYGDITVSGTGTVWTIDSGVVTSAKIADDTIVNADINSAAAIAHTKLANITAGSVLMGNASNVPTATALSGDVTIDSSGVTAISSGVIVNADINASAAIAGTKISPDFGSQNTTTTGTSTAASFIPTSSSAPTNGVYLPSANNVAISTNGSGRLFVDASGNVGVGTSTITGKLSLGSSQDFVFGNQSSTGSTGTGRLLATGGEVYIQAGLAATSGSNAPIVFTGYGGVGERMRLDSSGRLGVGSNSPQDTLSVYPGTTGGISLLDSGNTVRSRFFINNSSGGVGFATGIRTENYWLDFDASGAAQNAIRFFTGTGSLGTGTERMRLDSSGRLGLGTSSPSVKLEVSSADTTVCRLVTSDTGQSNVLAINNNSNYNYGTIGVVDGNGTSTGDVYGLGYLASLAGAATNVLSWTSQGRVGIGSTSPDSILDCEFSGENGITVQSTTSSNANITLKAATSTATNWLIQAGASVSNGLRFYDVTAGSERARIDSSGRLLVGTSTATKNADRISGNKIALAGVGSDQYPSYVVTGYSNSNADAGPIIDLQKSRGGSDGSMTVVASGDRLGSVNFLGADGTNFIRAAAINGEVDGTPGANDMPGRLVFSTTADGASSPTERVRINSTGQLLVGTTSDSSSVAGVHIYKQAEGIGRINFVKTYSGLVDALANYYSGTYVGGLTYSNTATALVTSSDARLKANIQDCVSAIDIVEQVRVVSHDWVNDDSSVRFGFVAQELNTVLPEAVRVGDNGEEVQQTWGVDYARLVPVLTKALQEALGKIEALETKVAALEGA